jgi:hypothetical protein
MLDKTPLRKIKLMQGDESVLVVAWATTSGTTTLAKVPFKARPRRHGELLPVFFLSQLITIGVLFLVSSLMPIPVRWFLVHH